MPISSGTIKVTAAGTRKQASHVANTRTMTFKARPDNAANVYIGGSAVSATAGMTLVPGESITLTTKDPISTSQFYADADTNNDQVDFIGSP